MGRAVLRQLCCELAIGNHGVKFRQDDEIRHLHSRDHRERHHREACHHALFEREHCHGGSKDENQQPDPNVSAWVIEGA